MRVSHWTKNIINRKLSISQKTLNVGIQVMKVKPTKKEVTSTSLKKETFKKCWTFVVFYLFLQILMQAYKLDWVLSAELLKNTWKESLFAIVVVPVIFFIQYKININKLNKEKSQTELGDNS
jgi:hypothetical protein